LICLGLRGVCMLPNDKQHQGGWCCHMLYKGVVGHHYLVATLFGPCLKTSNGEQARKTKEGVAHLQIPISYDIATGQYTLLPPVPASLVRSHKVMILLTNLKRIKPHEFDENCPHMDWLNILNIITYYRLKLA
jgi:hypothetical protein